MRNGFEKVAIMMGVGLLVIVGFTDSLSSDLESDPSTSVTAHLDRSSARSDATTGTSRAPGKDAAIGPERAARPVPETDALAAREAVTAAVEREAETDRPLHARLERAIARAESERGFTIHPGVVDTVLDRGEVRILFAIAVDDHGAARATLAAQGGASEGTDPDLRFFPLLGQGAARVDGEQLFQLIESGLLPSIDLDEIHRPSLATTIPLIRADEAHLAGHDGTGRTIAILDTGIETSHPMFAGRVVEEACFSLLGSCPDASRSMTGAGAAAPCNAPGCGHGTSVAGIALGRAEDDSLVGVAPDANLIAIRIFSDLGGGTVGAYTSDIVAGLQHVLGLSVNYAIDVTNLSLGGRTYDSLEACEAGASSTASAVDRLRDAGILTVAAGGNDGLVDAITAPACLVDVIGVGATTDADLVPGYSNSVDLLTMLAPGVSIESAAVGGGTSFVGGTSMAAPHVSGAVAVIRERHPLATPAEIENALVLAGVAVYDPRGDVTLPRLDVQGAIDLLTAAADAAVGSDSGGGASAPSSVSDGGAGGGGACGLVGLEPFLVVGTIRLLRGRKRRPEVATVP